ncbi:MAG: tetratricopeptide repeat protein [Phycisphaerales bacterium]|nr:MAG: tetratricopeptide repeat protein [Phycisphaerales bacterium]
MRRFRHILLPIIVLGFAALGVLAAIYFSAEPDTPEAITIGEAIRIDSAALGDARTVMVSLPRGYERSRTRYPVLYLLDADIHFHHATASVQFLARSGFIPQMLVVSPQTADRVRDFAPRVRRSGDDGPDTRNYGADWFLRFISEELIPYVDQNYRVDPYRVLAGNALGGTFSVYAMLTQPELFDAFIVTSPFLHWDNDLVTRVAGDTFDGLEQLDSFLFLAHEDVEGGRLTAIQRFVELLQNSAPRGLNWSFQQLANETSVSTAHRGLYMGLETLYAHWRIPNGLMDQGVDALEGHFTNLSREFGYDIEIPEYTLNALGYRLLNRDRIDQAIAVFQRNVQTYPDACNVYDSLGEAYLVNRDYDRAEANYKKALEMNPDFENPVIMLERIKRRRIEEARRTD